MALESNYDWHPASAGGSSWFKPWMAVAIILSTAVHAGLYLWFGEQRIAQDAAPTRGAIETLKDFKVQGVIDDPLTPKETPSKDSEDLAAIATPQDIVQQTPDPYELQK